MVEIELSVKFSPPFANTFPVSRNPMKKVRHHISFVLIFVLFLNSCTEKSEFDSFIYKSGGFGIEDYNFIVNRDSSYTLKVGFNPLNEDSTTVGSYKGKITSAQMETIQKAIAKITKEGYDYHNPEFTLDAGNYEVIINNSKFMKIYQTNNATQKFIIDIITPLNKICEETTTK